MVVKDRLNKIRQIALNEKMISVSGLSSIFQVTEETIRRDLEKLESIGFITRTYGGAILNARSQLDGIHFFKRAKDHLKEKQRIAINALSLLEDKTTIAVDSGTTTIETIKLLRDRTDLTILTNSTEIFHELELSNINVVSTGGDFNKNSLSLQGQLTESIIKQFHVDIMIMSCKGLDIEDGVLDSNGKEAEIKKVFLEQASEVVLLVDSSKFDQKAFVKLTEWANINYIVTEREPSGKWKAFCEDNEIVLIY